MKLFKSTVAAVVSLAVFSGVMPPSAAADPTKSPGSTEAVATAAFVAEEMARDLDAPALRDLPTPAAGAAAQMGLTTTTGQKMTIGLPTSGEPGVAAGAGVVYEAAGQQSALAVQSVDQADMDDVASGVMTTITIPDAQAPSSYLFPLDLPAGSVVDQDEDGNIAVLDAEGNALGVFPMPWAVDSDGKDVRTWFEVTSQGLVQHVDHEGAAYPVVADPAWLVPVLVVGGKVAIKVVVKAASKQAAKKAAAKAAAKKTGKKVTKTGAPAKLKYRPFNKNNYRHNLVVRTGKNPGNKCQAHHTIPQKLRAKAATAGVNIDDPQYLLWWVSTAGVPNNHSSKSKDYNRDWDAFYKKHANKPTKAQILAERTRLVKKYGKFYRC